MSRLDHHRSAEDSAALKGEELITPDAKRIVQLKDQTTNEYDPGVNRPQANVARAYAERLKERMSGSQLGADSLKTRKMPVGHVEMPSKEKFAAIAALSMPQPSFEEEEPGPQPPVHVQNPPRPQGVGSAYEVNQAMAAGKINKPVSLREAKKMEQGKKGLSKETLQAITMSNIAEVAQPPQATAEEVASVSEAMKSTPPVPPMPTRDLDKAEEKIVAKGEAPPDPLLGFEDVPPSVSSKLMSKGRREKIEAGLKPLDLADMILKREMMQEITIVPGKFSITLRTISQKENLWILQYIYDFPGSALYTRELLSTCQLVCALVSLNGAMLPDHRLNDETDKKAFEKKKEAIACFPTQLVADVSVQLMWFQDRVNKLFGLDEIKNG